MNEGEALAQVIEALAQEGFVRQRGANQPTFHGSVDVLDRTLRLAVVFPRLDFTVLPRVRLLDRATELPGHRAHVEDDDGVCYSSPGTLVLDMYAPGASALTVLDLTRRTLGEVLSGKAEEDLAIEFPQHWRGLLQVAVTLPPETPQGWARLVMTRGSGPEAVLRAFLCRNGPEEDTVDLGLMGVNKARSRRAFIARTPRMLGLRPGQALPSNLDEFLAWANEVDPSLREALMRGVVATDGAGALFVRGPNGCVGVLMTTPDGWKEAGASSTRLTRMLREHPDRVEVLRLSGVPADPDFIMSRNLGGAAGLAGRRVALVGCGTIGSHLAKFLVQSGAGFRGGRLDLYDDQMYAAANVGRHWLPPPFIGVEKAVACARELSSMFSGIDVRGVRRDASENMDDLLEADLVLDATGEEPLSAALNRAVVRARGGGPALLAVWLRGSGAAAQALFVPAVADGRGCMRCLRPGAGTWSVPDVMRTGLPETHAPAACGEAAFTAYGVAAPAIAAGLAVGMALEWAGGEVSPSFRTLRVDLAKTLPVDDHDLCQDLGCPVCGTR